MLDIEVFGVLTDDDQVDGFSSSADGLDRADVCVEVELLAEFDDGRGVAWGCFGWRAVNNSD